MWVKWESNSEKNNIRKVRAIDDTRFCSCKKSSTGVVFHT